MRINFGQELYKLAQLNVLLTNIEIIIMATAARARVRSLLNPTLRN